MLRDRMKAQLRSLLTRAHDDQRGAIVLLVLAGFLIVFMTAMVLYDAGEAARDKVDVQIAADTAAYSQAAVKARSMNMIAYANIGKRAFYAMDMMYTAAYLGMVEAAVSYSAACGLFNPGACFKALKGWAQIAVEFAEFVGGNAYTMGLMGARARQNVIMLDNYQDYMNAIAPWWGWGENLTRGIRNGATLTSSWPPPPGNLATLNNWWVKITQFLDNFLGTDYYQYYPSTGAKDSLPIDQSDGGFFAHAKMCAGTALSFPYFWFWGEHFIVSSSFARDPLAVLYGILSTPLGCIVASLLLQDEVLPYEVDPSFPWQDIGGEFTPSEWLQATSNITLSYKINPDKFADDGGGDRQKFNYMSADYEQGTPISRGGGYFAVTRSELVYDSGFLGDLASSLRGSLSGGSEATSVLGSRIGLVQDIFDQPDMWAARWTARMRPMQLPQEEVPNFNGIYRDMLPYIILSSPIAFANSPSEFSLDGAQNFADAALLDLAFMLLASSGLSDSDGARGFVK